MPERRTTPRRTVQPARREVIAPIENLPGVEFLERRRPPVGPIEPQPPIDPRLPRLPEPPRRPPVRPTPTPTPTPTPPVTRPSPIPPITIPGGGRPDLGETIIDRATLGVVDPRLLTKFLIDPPPVIDLKDGTPTRPIVVDDTSLQRLVREALVAAGKTVVWTGPGRELLVRLGETKAGAVAGGVGVGFDVESGNGRTPASVMLTVARAKAPAGMIASASAVEIPDDLEVWAESIVAAAWQALLSVAVRLCSQAGLDRGGASFVPAGLYAEPGHLGVVPRARHRWER